MFAKRFWTPARTSVWASWRSASRPVDIRHCRDRSPIAADIRKLESPPSRAKAPTVGGAGNIQASGTVVAIEVGSKIVAGSSLIDFNSPGGNFIMTLV
jgi:hypothetical protein